ncbi:MAG TPA: glycosyltransferase [Planctomycetota bacterium]|nr:glycosyltransferase [Planctomycetota bacterium]
MRIGFDTSALVRAHPPGIVRLVSNAMAALERLPGLTALRMQPEASENLRVWRQVKLPLLVRERGLVGLHSFVSAFALLGPGVRVQTIHELPWLHGAAENSGLGHRFWARLASRRADRILCGSEFVAREVGVGPLAKRVSVCSWGVDAEHFGHVPSVEVQARARELLHIADASGAVFAIGAVRAKKNLAALLRGMGERKRRGMPAVAIAVSGAIGPDALRDQALAKSLGLEHEVRWLGQVDEALLVALIHESSAIALLSHSEGFGLPVLEAFAAGRSVIVPRHSAPSEVAAGLGIEVNPDDATSVAEGIEQSLHDTPRDPLRRAHAATRSWSVCAERIAEVWREFA